MAGWITINGAHIYVKEGENVAAAFERTTGRKITDKENASRLPISKKFTINNALKKAAEDRDSKNMKALKNAQRTGNRDEMLRQEGVIRNNVDDELEAKELTEKGKEARKAREEKKAENSKINNEVRTSPKLGAPERGNILSVGTYKGYSIDKDIFGGKGVTVNIDGDEAVFNSPEEAMREIDKIKKR